MKSRASRGMLNKEKLFLKIKEKIGMKFSQEQQQKKVSTQQFILGIITSIVYCAVVLLLSSKLKRSILVLNGEWKS